MANEKISAMPAAAAFGGTELIAMVQSGANVAGTPNQMKTSVLGNVVLTNPASTATFTLTAGKTLVATNSLTFSGVDGKTFTLDNTLEFAGTDGTKMTFPATSDTVVTLTATQTLTNKTLTSPTLTTPSLGVATASSINRVAITAPASNATLTLADGKTLTVDNTLTFVGTDGTTLTFPSSSDTVVTLAATQTLSNKTFVAPVLGAATATSINKVALTAPATGSTLTILDGKTFTANNSITLAAGADGQTFTFPSASDTVAGLGTTQTFTAAQTSSKAGASSTPAFLFTGTPFTGSGTTSFPLIYLNGGTAPTNFSTGGTYLGINGTASFGGNFIDVIANGGSHVFTVNAGGSVTSGSTITSGVGFNASSGGIAIAGAFAVTFTGRGILSSPGGGSIQLGSSDAASPVAQTLGPQNVVGGTSNTAGANWTIRGSRGTGTGVGGNLIFQVAPPSTTGSTQNALVTALTINNIGVPVLPSFIVSALPSATTAGVGAIAVATDLLAPTLGGTAVGGGAITGLVISTGSAWVS